MCASAASVWHCVRMCECGVGMCCLITLCASVAYLWHCESVLLCAVSAVAVMIARLLCVVCTQVDVACMMLIVLQCCMSRCSEEH